MAAAFGPDVGVGRVERLRGGMATAIHRVELRSPAGAREVVLKRFPPGSPVPENEWNALHLVTGTSVPTPRPVLLDAGDWFDGPCIVAEHLPGAPDLDPRDPARWIDALAGTLAAIHATPVPHPPAWLRRPAIWHRWDGAGLPDGPRTTAIRAAVDALRARSWTETLCHGDFHPGNVLFEDGAVVGVVDWASTRVASPLSDLGRARAALAIWPGGDAPDRFTDAYALETGRPLDGLPLWDVLSGALTLEHAPFVPLLYESFDVPIATEEIGDRAAAFVERALERQRRPTSWQA
jgi:aminoglycoside phosphotransferase (APT) family kinase protein